MHTMKTLIMTMAILALIIFSGIHSFLDDYVFAWIPSVWIVHAQRTLLLFIGLSIIAYAALYIYYVCRHIDKHTSPQSTIRPALTD